jgi:hypothetical protein
MSKKLVIPRASLPVLDTAGLNFQIRYRIVSEDRNRLSAWTPIYSVNASSVYIPQASANTSDILSTQVFT